VKKQLFAAAAAFGVVASLVATAPAAFAEPVSPGYVAVGSDTLQDVMNALANGTSVTGSSVRATAQGQNFGNFDAVEAHFGTANTVKIQVKAGGPLMTRPNGSSAGKTALSRSINATGTEKYDGVTITGQIDIARSSSKGTESASGLLWTVPFGRDALTYAYKLDTANAAWENIDKATLTSIFNCTTTTLGGVAVTPVVPQAGSGTRKDFIAILGLTETTLVTVSEGGCVKEGQEHDSSTLLSGELMPMSAAQWVAQNTGAGVDRRGAGVVVGSPVAGTTAVTGTGSSMVPNPTFYADSTWGRDTVLLVEYARVNSGDPKYDARLADLIGTGAQKLGNISSPLSSSVFAVKKKFGFLAPQTTTGFRQAAS